MSNNHPDPIRRELWFIDGIGIEHHITSISWESRDTLKKPSIWKAHKLNPDILGLIERIFIEREGEVRDL